MRARPASVDGGDDAVVPPSAAGRPVSSLTARHLRPPAGTTGFTLLELIVAIVIVGILAAVAVPQYHATTRRAYEAAAKEDLRNLMTAEEIFRHRNDSYSDGTQATAGAPVLDENGEVLIRTSHGVTVTVTAGADGFTAVAGHPRAERWWCVNTADGPDQIEAVPPDGSC